MTKTAQIADKEYLHLTDLKAMGLVSNWSTLLRWMERGFPKGIKIGPGTRVWERSEIEGGLIRNETKNDGSNAGKARLVMAGSGMATQGRSGEAGHSTARPGKARYGRQGMAW